MRNLKAVPVAIAVTAPGSMASSKNVLKPGSSKFAETVDFVRRKGLVSTRDVAARFGLSDRGARIRLDTGVELGALVQDGDRWAAVVEV
jgi:hypothetical protein